MATAAGGTWVIDLDGVVWLAGDAQPRRRRAVARLRGVGVRVLFATNNTCPTRAELHRQLAHCGITADDADLLRSADVAAGMLAPGSSAVVLAGDGVLEALAARGVLVVPEGPADAVVVGLTRDFTYDKLSRAVTAVRNGARLVGTNEDATSRPPTAWCPGPAPSSPRWSPPRAGRPRWRKPHRPTADAIAAHVGAGSCGSWWGIDLRPTVLWGPPSWAIPFGSGPVGCHQEGGDPTRRRSRRRGTGPAPARRPGAPRAPHEVLAAS